MSFNSPNEPGYLRLAIFPSLVAQTAVLPDPAKVNWVRRVNGTEPFSEVQVRRFEPAITRFIQAIA